MMFSFNLFGLHSTNLSATKRDDGISGLVSIKGWSETLKRVQAVTFAVADTETSTTWIRTLTNAQFLNMVEPLEVSIPRSSTANRIVVNAYYLKQQPGSEISGATHITIQTQYSCVAHEDSGASGLFHGDPSLVSEIKPFYSIPLEVEIDRSQTFNKAKLVIKRTPGFVTHWKISVKRSNGTNTDKSMHVFFLAKSLSYGEQEFQFPIRFKAGRKYIVLVQGLSAIDQFSPVQNNEYRVLYDGSAEFKTELTTGDILSLHSKAVEHSKWYGISGTSRCLIFYRNKPQHYFTDIFSNHDGIMKPYIKDNSGDPGSPINGQINGLFFMASVEPGTTSGVPVQRSAFGSTRLLVRSSELLSITPNVYFADFYCMRGQYHYVTLVLTKPRSETDQFCANRLFRLSLYDKNTNPFLFYDDSGELRVTTRDHLHVELLFTENLDINPYKSTLQMYTPLIGKGQTTPGGIPKNSNCRTCNLSPSENTSLFMFDDPLDPF